MCPANAAIVSLIVELNYIHSAWLKISNQHILSPCQTMFSWVDFFVIIVTNARTVSLEAFLFPFASMVLSVKSRPTTRYFTPLKSLASLSTCAKSIHRIPFSNPAKSFSLLNSRVARVNFV